MSQKPKDWWIWAVVGGIVVLVLLAFVAYWIGNATT